MNTEDRRTMHLSYQFALEKLFRRERVYRDRQNPLEVFPLEDVRRKFRFWPSTILVLCQVFMGIGPSTKRSHALPTLWYVLG